MNEIPTRSLNDKDLNHILYNSYEELFHSCTESNILRMKNLVRGTVQRAVEEYQGRPSELLSFLQRDRESMAAGVASSAYLALTGDITPAMRCVWGGLGAEFVTNGQYLRALSDGEGMHEVRGHQFSFATLGGDALAGANIIGSGGLNYGFMWPLNFSDLYGGACMYAKTRNAMLGATLHDFAGARSRNVESLQNAVLLDNSLKGSRNKDSLNYCNARGNAGQDSVNKGSLTYAKLEEDSFVNSRFDRESLLGAKFDRSILQGADKFHRTADRVLETVFSPVTHSVDFVGDKLWQLYSFVSGQANNQSA